MKIAQWADYLQKLGIGAVLVNPPLESDSHGYDTRSLRHIDRRLGGDADFAAVCETLHAYYFPKTARWELKRTHWYELHASGCAGLTPQTEEGIDSAVWCAPREVADNLRDAFPTIRCVAAAMGRN